MDIKDLAPIIAALDAQDEKLTADIERLAEELDMTSEAREKVRAAKAVLTAVEVGPAPFGGKLAEACREVLKRNVGRSMAPTEIRDGLKQIKYNTEKHSNLLASIHSVMRKMADSDEVKEVRSKTSKDGSTRYYWTGDKDAGTLKNTQTTADQIQAMKAAFAAPILPPATHTSFVRDMAQGFGHIDSLMKTLGPQLRSIDALRQQAETSGVLKLVEEAQAQLDAINKKLPKP
jgi:hypothetical protein